MERYVNQQVLPGWGKVTLQFATCFVVLFLLTVSLPHSYLPLPAELIAQPFDWLAELVGRTVFGLDISDRSVSDGAGMQVHVLNITLISALSVLLWHLFPVPTSYASLSRWLIVLSRYVLAWQLLQYGLNKVFKWQFYLPEPNIQYSQVRQLGSDMLYWTTMGVSRSYSVFLGAVEVLISVLLLWRRMSLVAALLAFGLLLNVLMVNIGFGITVIMLTSFLMLLCIIIIHPHVDRLRLLLLVPITRAHRQLPVFRHRTGTIALKAFVTAVIVSDAAWPYVRTGNLNDDVQPRPPLHGAYEVTATTAGTPLKRFFIHRRGYFIVQDSLEAFTDYELETDTADKVLWISRPDDSLETALYYTLSGGDNLRLTGWIGRDSVAFTGKKLRLRW